MRTIVFSLITIFALLAFAYISLHIQSSSSGFVFVSLLIVGLAAMRLGQHKQQPPSERSAMERNRV